ncbi:AIPR family protein [Pseudalkalibacillus sp. Hm43]|uniref:AIPR family protein n=1 Tax=Pseudalkalibacillus sp. Hm43 TaxID=3450742 RepID=UPI003F42DA11
MQKISLKVNDSSFTSMANPNDPSITHYQFYIPCESLVDLPTEANPREQNMNTKVVKQIKETLRDPNKTYFEVLNRGLTITCSNLVKHTGEVTLTFTNSEDGLIDGGHTARSILEVQEEGINLSGKYVRAEVFTGLDFEKAVELAKTRNTNVAVKEYSIAELEGRFQFLKEAIKGKPFENRVGFKQNEDKEIEVKNLLQVMNVFNLERYDNMKQPTVSYVANSKPIDYFLEKPEPFHKLAQINPTVFDLHENIEKKWKKAYNSKKGAMYGKNKCAKAGETRQVLFGNDGDTIDYYVPSGLLLPVLASFRSLLEEHEGKYQWKVDPLVVLDEVLPELTSQIHSKLSVTGGNPNAVGKDSQLWLMLYMIVERQIMITK